MKQKSHIQTQEEWEEEISIKILKCIRDDLYMEFPFMGIALSALQPKREKRIHTLATDGQMLYFSSEQLMRVFPKNPKYLNRVYFHTILHCLFSHLWIKNKREERLWNVACDIAVEYTIDHMEKEGIKRILGWVRQRTYGELQENNVGISPSQIYGYLLQKDGEQIQELYEEFFTDDHGYWPKEKKKQMSAQEVMKNWNKISRQTSLEQKKRGDEVSKGQELLEKQLQARQAKRSYREFLQKFSVEREELVCDPDEFDMNFYTYGLSLYKNMPLIEPVESREIKKIQEFVVVLDTSYSTSGSLIQNFLQETFDVLYSKESYFKHYVLHVLQCDEKVQSDVRISNEKELREFFDHFTLCGGGGTDFRPAFAYVDQLIQHKELKNLGGLLYFTDGKGIYPKKKPAYKTAFLFLEDFEEDKVPPWAMKYKMQKNGEQYEHKRSKNRD